MFCAFRASISARSTAQRPPGVLNPAPLPCSENLSSSFQLEKGRTKGRWGHISQQVFAFILFQYIYIELSPPRRCLSISCINFVSYVDFLYWPLRHFLRFCCCIIRTSPASTTSCMHLVSISKFHPTCAIVSNKNHKKDNVSQFVSNLCELEGPRCLNRSTLG